VSLPPTPPFGEEVSDPEALRYRLTGLCGEGRTQRFPLFGILR
jgi:hypothetical protein